MIKGGVSWEGFIFLVEQQYWAYVEKAALNDYGQIF